MRPQPLIDRDFLEKLERLTISWRKSFRGLVGGHNPSRLAGSGQEFLDHRHFHHGDDLRAVNWRAYLRLEKMFLKVFQVEPRTPIRILLDVSMSMDTSTPVGLSKFDYARKLAAALSYVGLVQHDMIHIHPFHGELMEGMVAGGGRHNLAPTVRFLAGLQPAGKTVFLQVARQFISEYPQRGLVLILSDFFEDNDCERPLQFLGDFGHELLLIRLWTEADRTPPWDGELELVDAETGAVSEVSFGDEARQRYTHAFDEFGHRLRMLALRYGGRYVGLSTATSLEDAVFGALARAEGIV